jgi:nucleoside-diphosphate-sugar epimerase
MAKKGTIGLMGDGDTKHSYVCIDDLAEFLVNAIDNPAARNKTFDIGGPQPLSQNGVVKIFEKVMGRPLMAKRTPALVFRIGYGVLRIVSPAAANIMGLNYHTAVNSSVVDMSETAKLFNVRLTSAEEFLRQRASGDGDP